MQRGCLGEKGRIVHKERGLSSDKCSFAKKVRVSDTGLKRDCPSQHVTRSFRRVAGLVCNWKTLNTVSEHPVLSLATHQAIGSLVSNGQDSGMAGEVPAQV